MECRKTTHDTVHSTGESDGSAIGSVDAMNRGVGRFNSLAYQILTALGSPDQAALELHSGRTGLVGRRHASESAGGGHPFVNYYLRVATPRHDWPFDLLGTRSGSSTVSTTCS